MDFLLNFYYTHICEKRSEKKTKKTLSKDDANKQWNYHIKQDHNGNERACSAIMLAKHALHFSMHCVGCKDPFKRSERVDFTQLKKHAKSCPKTHSTTQLFSVAVTTTPPQPIVRKKVKRDEFAELAEAPGLGALIQQHVTKRQK